MKLNRIEFGLMNNPIRAFIQEQYEIKAFLNNKSHRNTEEVLEIGCGNGQGAYLINKYFHPLHITGIDLDNHMVDIARNKFPQFSFTQGDVTKLDFSDNHFDLIFDFGVIHHIPNWEQTLGELYRVLKKGGQVFIEDFSSESFQSLTGNLLKRILDHPYNKIPKRKEFFDYLEKLGFKITKKVTRKPLGLVDYFVVIASK